ncbi:MAG: tRNA (adenosine(37)-N6)-dimethylallyltransferase MiaA [Deltaproteobacteria bacterium]
MNKVLVILGPTAVGKTNLSIELAKRVNGEIISADSMQIYKYMDIGTAKPNLEEMQGIKHYLIDTLEPNEECNVAKYKEMAEKCIEEILNKNKMPLIVGGTGLYVNSVVDNIEFTETLTDWNYRTKLEEKAGIEGTDILYKELEKVDFEAAEKIHPNDLRRIIRALEVYHSTGIPISCHNKVSKQNLPKYDFAMIGLNTEREVLYKRIDLRVDEMFKRGLVDEVKKLIEIGISSKNTSMQGLGYKEVVDYLEGRALLNEAVEIIKMNSRRYAKRQLTWFRRDKRIQWFDINEGMENIIKKILIYLEAKDFFI